MNAPEGMFRVAPPGAYTVLLCGGPPGHYRIEDIRLFNRPLLDERYSVTLKDTSRVSFDMHLANWSFSDMGWWTTKEEAQAAAADWIDQHRALHFWYVPE